MVCYEYLNEGDWLGLGNYYTPDILVTIPKPDGSGQVNAILESDSGAAITLLPSGYATLLGIVLTSGTPITLGGVGGSSFVCYIHVLDMVIGEQYLPKIPVAFAPTNDFPPLLGRLGLYDAITVIMDNEQHATCFGEVSEPLPSPSNIVWPEIPDLLNSLALPILVIAGLAVAVMVVK
jgi:hypothetical protein